MKVGRWVGRLIIVKPIHHLFKLSTQLFLNYHFIYLHKSTTYIVKCQIKKLTKINMNFFSISKDFVYHHGSEGFNS
jgi:hypothetical protein